MPYVNVRGQLMPETAAEQARIEGTSAGGETVQAPAGNSSVSGFGGGDVLIGSSGDNRHWIADPRDVVRENPGGGIDTEIGWTAIKAAPNVENLIVHGDYNFAAGNELANLIIVDGKQWVYGGAGDDVLVGGFNPVTFVVRAGEGSDVIYGWNALDKLQLWNYGFSTAGQIKGAMTQQGADVVLRFGNGESLTFRDTNLAAFQDQQFLTPLDRSKLGGLTFSDEFDNLSLYDPSTGAGRWRADFGSNPKDQWAYTLVSNGEQQAYVRPGFEGRGEQDIGVNPFGISGGQLTITAQRTSGEDTYATFGHAYTSGMLNTIGLFQQKYGYFEMRAETPAVAGAWPAFWLFPPTPGSAEGDIMESLGLTPNVDYRRAYGGSTDVYDNAFRVDATGMHTYGMLWSPQTVTFYYDDVMVLQSPTPSNWTEPMSMIVNMAVGGWGGNPDPNNFFAQFKIDYVHAYALADGSTQTVNLQPAPPVATLKDAGSSAGAVNSPVAFGDGQAVTTAHIALSSGGPGAVPGGRTFVVYDQGGAVFGAVSNNGALGAPVTLTAGSIGQFSANGTWLTTGKVVVGYMGQANGQAAAFAVVFDPASNTFVRHELGPAVGDIRFVATAGGGFAASWDAPDGSVMGRGYDEYAYGGDVPGWYGPIRHLAGDILGVTASGQVIAGGQLYTLAGASSGGGGSGGAQGSPTMGNDNLQGSNVSGMAGDDTIAGTPGLDFIRGDEGNDRLIGGDAFDDINGNMGNDTIYGGQGDDWVVGGKDNDLLYGEEGGDIGLGNLGDDTVDGGVGNDIVRGGQGNDTVTASFGDDFVSGDRGDDTLSGGGGADTFHVFDGSNLDLVIDFNRQEGDRVMVLPGQQYSVSQQGADVVIDVVGGGHMVLQNVQMSTLTPGWIF